MHFLDIPKKLIQKNCQLKIPFPLFSSSRTSELETMRLLINLIILSLILTVTMAIKCYSCHSLYEGNCTTVDRNTNELECLNTNDNDPTACLEVRFKRDGGCFEVNFSEKIRNFKKVACCGNIENFPGFEPMNFKFYIH
jgi:hypothetical protein